MAKTGNGSGGIDISYGIKEGMMHWPMSPIYPHIDWVLHPSKGHEVTMSHININTHNGTHVDSPRHFYADGKTIEDMPLDALMGPTRVIEIKDKDSIKSKELEAHNIKAGERILFKTRNSELYKTDKFVEDYVYIETEAGRYLKDKKVSVVGIDYQAIGTIKDKQNIFDVHKILLGAGIWVIEVINLSGVKAGMYEMICLPLRIKDGDAGPARAIIRPI